MANQIFTDINHSSGENDKEPKAHFVLVPLMAQGHTIPMIDMARALADRNVLVTVVTTPVNAALMKPIITRLEDSGATVQFLVLRFPCVEVGLPDGSENADTLPSRDFMMKFFEGTKMLKEPLINHLRSTRPAPDCIISDVWHPWTREVAAVCEVPRFIFNGQSCFSTLCEYYIPEHKVHENANPETEHEAFVVPGLLHRVELTRAQTPGYLNVPGLDKLRDEMREAELASDGVIVNSFHDLEPEYSKLYEKTTGKRVWTIGPTSLYNSDPKDIAARGSNTAIDELTCRSWLDSMKPNSVLYVSFGSLANTPAAQLIEIGVGLESSDKPFIWVIKTKAKDEALEEWLKSFEERIRGRGLVIRGWAPQVMILSHPSVGGFMTHCGWNSTLESISSGVPMITWPLFAEQFINEKLVVEVLNIGVVVGVKSPTEWAVESNEVKVKGSDVEKAVKKLMDGGDEIRERAKRLGDMAQRAVKESGSSHVNLANLVKHVLD